MMKSKTCAARLYFLALGLALSLAGCGSQSGVEKKTVDTTSERIRLAGSSTVAPLMKAIAARFKTTHPLVEIDISTGGSTKGIEAARAGTVEIGMASRELNPSEQDLYSFSIARDGVCCLVHKDNPVQTLSKLNAREIFKGQITNWKAVGGKDAPIRVLTRTEGRAEVEVFTHYLEVEPREINAAATIGENQDGIKAVAADPNAIIYVSVGESEREMARGTPIKMLDADNIHPDSNTVRRGIFPISRSLILITKDLPRGAAKALIDFALSPQNKDIIVECQFIPFSE